VRERLVVQGSDLVSNITGLPVILRGSSWGRFGFVQPGDGQMMVDWGANCVRIPLRYDGYYNGSGIDARDDSAPGGINPVHLAIHDFMMDQAESRGLWTIITLDSDCGQNGLQSPEVAAYCDPSGTFPQGRNLWRDPAARARHIAACKFLAARNAHRNRVALFEGLPEPSPADVLDEDIRAFYSEQAAEVRPTGLGAPFLVGAQTGYNANRCDKAFNPAEKDFVYTGNIFAYTEQQELAGVLQNITDRAGKLVQMRIKRNVPMIVQQWGVESGADPTGEIFAHLANTMLLNNMHSIHWHVDDPGNPNGYGVFYTPHNGSRIVKPNVLSMLQAHLAGLTVQAQAAGAMAVPA
jgi:hypothetical protein